MVKVMNIVNDSKLNYMIKMCGLGIVVFLLLSVSYFYLGGESLFYKESTSEIKMLEENSGTIELIKGQVVEQEFLNEIDVLKSIEIQWGTYNRHNKGSIDVEIIDNKTSNVLFKDQIEAENLKEGEKIKIEIPNGESYRNKDLRIRITSESQAGEGATPLMANGTVEKNQRFWINGVAQNATLCFATYGLTELSFGNNYWYGVLGILTLLIVFSCALIFDTAKNNRNYLAASILNIKRYDFLMKQLVLRDFKTKYTRSVLGVLWSFLNPLLTMVVQYFVFSTIFKSDIPNYAVYLLIGIVEFNFFSEAVNMAMMSILVNSNLIKKVYLPKYIYPITRIISSVINLVISFIPLSIVGAVTGLKIHRSSILALFFIICLIIFCLGLGMVLSSSMVFFRDTQFLWGVLSMIWMYATPIFYPESIIPAQFNFVLKINPIYYYMKFSRMCVINGVSPEPMAYFISFAFSIVMLMIGCMVFKKTQDKFILYL